MSGPHDRLVRETFARGHAASWLLAAALAPLRSDLPIALSDSALLHGKERRADLAFDLKGINLRVFIEHQSSPRHDMALRCVEHLALAARSAQHDDPDAPTPRLHFLVLFQGPGRWAPATRLASAEPILPPHIAGTAVAHAYDVCHLEDLPLHRAPPDARVAVRVLLRAANAPRGAATWALTAEDLADLQQVREHLGSSAIFTVISYLTSISTTPAPETLMAQLQQQHPELADDFVSYHDQLLREGERIGEERAAKQLEARLRQERERAARERERAAQERERAAQERERAARQQRDLLLQLATQRFGEPTDLQRRRARAFSTEQTHAAMTRLLTANGWDELLG